MSSIIFLGQNMMYYLIPLMIVALAAMFSERSGVINIAMEGTMIMGAFSGTLFIYLMQKNGTLGGFPLLICALLVSMVVGMLFNFFHAFASINMMADQTISGTAMNMFAPAFAIFAARSVIGIQQVQFLNEFRVAKVPLLSEIPIIGPIFFENTYFTTLLGFLILIGSQIVIYHTRFGLRLRSAGEFPQATDAAGVSVYKMRYSGVLISGALAGLGGLIYIIPISTNFNADVSGYGFLAIAVIVFDQWKPLYIFFGAAFFGLTKTISAGYTGIAFLSNLGIPRVIYEVLPYVATLVILVLTSKKSAAPAAEGEPFDKGKR